MGMPGRPPRPGRSSQDPAFLTPRLQRLPPFPGCGPVSDGREAQPGGKSRDALCEATQAAGGAARTAHARADNRENRRRQGQGVVAAVRARGAGIAHPEFAASGGQIRKIQDSHLPRTLREQMSRSCVLRNGTSFWSAAAAEEGCPCRSSTKSRNPGTIEVGA
jgi:hypothetical protein